MCFALSIKPGTLLYHENLFYVKQAMLLADLRKYKATFLGMFLALEYTSRYIL